MLTYYDRIGQLPDDQLKIGLARLGRAIKASRSIQGMTGRQLTGITKAIHGKGVSPTHVSDLEKGIYRIPREYTLQRLVKMGFEVDYFDCVGNDLIGIPHFKYQGEDYGAEKTIRLKRMAKYKFTGTNEQDRPKISDLPDLEYRFSSIESLVKILTCESRTIITSSRQMYTPSRVLSLAS